MPAYTPVLTAEQLREIDRRATDEFAIPSLLLMENAGRGCADLLLARGARGSVAVCCGKGNNGGDGYVIARHLDAAGIDVRILSAVSLEELTGDAAAQAQIAQRSQLPLAQPGTFDDWSQALQGAEWIVDALLGTGLSGPARGMVAVAIAAINAAASRRFAVDLPSGWSTTAGEPAGECVQAELTGTFVALKPGLANPVHHQYAGEVVVLPIGVPRCLLRQYVVA